jgi:hypothetical protein
MSKQRGSCLTGSGERRPFLYALQLLLIACATLYMPTTVASTECSLVCSTAAISVQMSRSDNQEQMSKTSSGDSDGCSGMKHVPAVIWLHGLQVE